MAKSRAQYRVLFVNPCLRKKSYSKLLPVGLAMVMTYVVGQGYSNYHLLDVDLHELEDEAVLEHLRENPYDAIMLGSIVTHYKWIKWFVRNARQLQPQARLIVGNSVAGSIPELFLQNAPADAVVIGEGEISAFEVLEAFRTGADLAEVEGIAYRATDGSCQKTPKRKALKIDSFPMVEWDFFDVEQYIVLSSKSHAQGADGRTARVMPVTTARGCAFKCTFCHYVFWNDPYRHRSPESVLAEVRRNMERYQANYISFWDDLSFASVKQVHQICDAILESGLKFHWDASIRADLLSRNKLSEEEKVEVVRKMRQSGCLSVGFSLESGSPEILDMMNKKIEVEDFFETVRHFREQGIVCNTSVVFGYPIETLDTIRATFEQCVQARVYPSIGFLLPLPSTGMYDYALEHGFITDEDRFLDSITERQDICLNMTSLSDEEIMGAITEGAKELNTLLELGLSEDKFIRTQRYQNDRAKHEKRKAPLDPDNMVRNENDFSFNYSAAVFEMDTGCL